MTILSELKTARTATKAKLKSNVTILRTALTGGAAIDPTSLARKVSLVEQFWTEFETNHAAYLVKLNPTEEQMEAEMDFWTSEFTIKEEILQQGKAQLEIANAPVDVEPEPPDNTVSIRNLKAEIAREKGVAEQEVKRVEDLTGDADQITNQTALMYSKVVDRCEESLRLLICPLYSKLIELDDANHEEHNQSLNNYMMEFQGRLNRARIQIASKESNQANTVQNEIVPDRGVVNKPTLYFQKSKFPEFSGARRDYPGFRKEWRQCVSPNYDGVFQLREIAKRVPKEIEPDIKNATEMDEVWQILDHEYGQAVDICGEAVEELRVMVPSGKTDAHKFIELYRKYTRVKNDLIEFGRLKDLDNLPVIKALSMKFPSHAIKLRYTDFRVQQRDIDQNVSEFEILDGFMKREKGIQQDMLKLEPQSTDSKSTDSKNKDENIKCLNCGELGHR